MDRVRDIPPATSGPSIGPLNALVLPVRPVYVVLEGRDAEYMRQVAAAQQVPDFHLWDM